MSYSQKMRSWIGSALLGLLAVLLWKGAQTIETYDNPETMNRVATLERTIKEVKERLDKVAGPAPEPELPADAAAQGAEAGKTARAAALLAQ